MIGHPFRDHAQLLEADTQFNDDLPVVMTEKDAVKCRRFARDGLWYLPVEVEFVADSNMMWLDNLQRLLDDYAMQNAK